jgi:hypothetical protein
MRMDRMRYFTWSRRAMAGPATFCAPAPCVRRRFRVQWLFVMMLHQLFLAALIGIRRKMIQRLI